MAVQFRCGGCEKLLQVPDDAVGKNARCTQCGHISTVPSAMRAAVVGQAEHFADGAGAVDLAPRRLRRQILTARRHVVNMEGSRWLLERKYPASAS